MGTLFSTLDIARSGLQVAQAQIDVAGHNIANVNKQGFSRQRVELTTRTPHVLPYGQLGRGVQVGQVARIRDNFLDLVFRQQVAGLGQAEVRGQFFSRLENVFLEPGPNGFSTRFNVFFDALSDFADNVESFSTRQSVLAEAQAMAGSFRSVAERLNLLRTDANEEVKALVPEMNGLGGQIAALNVRIRQSELNGTKANDLRDDRDALLDQLAKLAHISYRERANGQIDVLIGSDVFVDGGFFRTLVAQRDPALDPVRGDLVTVRFGDTGKQVEATSGALYGALQMRDVVVPALDARVDTLAAAFITQLNSIQNRGIGLSTFSAALASTNWTTDSVTPLNAAGLPFDLTSGTFDLVVYDAAGTPTTFGILVDPAVNSLSDLAGAINAATGGTVTAAITAGGRSLSLSPSAGYTFSVGSDSSGVLTALGVNGLFTGSDASNIAVSQTLIDNPGLLTSRFTTDLLNTGDNSAALAMAALRTAPVLEDGTSTLLNYYESAVVRLGVDARTNTKDLEMERAFVDDFDRRRMEVSGVSLDEEITYMIQFQRAFEGAARVVTVTDRMLEALLTMAL